MDFLNIGSGEFLFLLLLAILLIGPRRAVELVQQVSRFAAHLQREWRTVQQEIAQEWRTLQEETARAVQPVLQESAQVRREAQNVLREVAAEARGVQERTAAASSLESPSVSLSPEIQQPADDFAG
ncbi:MAG: hypothetical protein RMK65_09560 [Anaerolineae bacterium]|nr:hypothetical protein [Anaerolineae bacterium]MCX8067108.1 hypothetical protein [Anaerolineae bacterium]MDW7992353.1 hypothetical protein [Anaerolineae bacterium]